MVELGVPERYFDAHFRLVRVVERPGDVRVIWKYSLNGYETSVTDTIGYYTADNKTRVYVHSLKTTLGAAREITRTVPRAQARAELQKCLGRYTAESVLFTKLPGEKTAALYLTARTRVERKRESEEEREKEKARAKAAEKTPPPAAQAGRGGTPPPRKMPSEEEENEKRPPIYVGYINLETGKCTKIAAVVAP
jgi:hypothetical protein